MSTATFRTATLILAAILIAPFAMGQDKSTGRDSHTDDPIRGIDLAFKQLALENERSKIGFEMEMRQLQLKQKQMEMEQGRPAFEGGGRPPRGQWGPGAMGPGCPMPGNPGGKGQCCPVFLLWCAAIHLLLAYWVNSDIKQRKVGSRVWIVVALLSGLLGTFVYALVRMGDRPA